MKMRGPTSVLLLVVSVLATAPQGVEAQKFSYTRGQPLYPAYEGWTENPDGSFNMLFGYMNENWEQELELPVGSDNQFSPGRPDQGQPTHFYPRRNRYVFEVQVPRDFEEDDELVWTLRANGAEYRAYGTLRPDLFTDNVIIMSETGALGAGASNPEIRANIPPMIELEGGVERSVRVGETLRLAAVVTDDGQPSSISFFETAGETEAEDDEEEEVEVEDEAEEDEAEEDEEEDAEPTPRELLERALGRGTASGTVGKRVGLHYTWFVYRGPGEAVKFDPPQIKTWEETRPFGNSPWTVGWVLPDAPEDGRWVSEVTFSEPGTYVIRGRADDGGLYSDVEITVQVQSTVF
jgi:hypothetical protein